MNKEVLYGILGLAIGILLSFFVVSNSATNTMTNMMGVRNQNSQTKMTNIDKHFIEQMIPHHEDAITMAKLAQTKAQKPEVKQLAEDIISSQGKEIDQMKSWYKNWFAKDVPTNNQVMNQHGMMGNNNMHMGMMGDTTDMLRLEQAENFDKVFIEEMIPHHQMAVMMANMLLHGTNRDEMKNLAQDIIDAQTKEINEMRKWHKNWGY